MRFLNEPGQGTVMHQAANGLLMVDVDGFEIPFPANELVPATNTYTTEKVQAASENKTMPENPFAARSTPEGLYLSYTPDAEKNKDFFRLLLHNHTEYNIVYVVAKKSKGELKKVDTGNLPAFSGLQLGAFPKSELEGWTNFHIQALFYKENMNAALQPFAGDVVVKATKFYKENLFEHSALTDSNSLLVPVIQYDVFYKPLQYETKLPVEEMLATAVRKEIERDTSKISRPHARKTEKEVDLHIEELIDDVSGMSNDMMIKLQLLHFQRELDQALAEGLHKIIFIHGVGKGTLKNEIRKILSSYAALRFSDAPYHKYGYGATEVLLK